jgi:hypothetical protein
MLLKGKEKDLGWRSGKVGGRRAAEWRIQAPGFVTQAA